MKIVSWDEASCSFALSRWQSVRHVNESAVSVSYSDAYHLTSVDFIIWLLILYFGDLFLSFFFLSFYLHSSTGKRHGHLRKFLTRRPHSSWHNSNLNQSHPSAVPIPIHHYKKLLLIQTKISHSTTCIRYSSFHWPDGAMSARNAVQRTPQTSLLHVSSPWWLPQPTFKSLFSLSLQFSVRLSCNQKHEPKCLVATLMSSASCATTRPCPKSLTMTSLRKIMVGVPTLL